MSATKRKNGSKGAKDTANKPKAKRPKQGWTGAEDCYLKLLVEQEKAEGATSFRWSAIASKMKGRSGKQCRERWYNQLDPDKKNGPWTEEEDATLFILQKKLGNQWTVIGRHLPGRTDNDVKNRWYSVMRTRAKKAKKKSKEAAKRAKASLITKRNSNPVLALHLPQQANVSPALSSPASTFKHDPQKNTAPQAPTNPASTFEYHPQHEKTAQVQADSVSTFKHCPQHETTAQALAISPLLMLADAASNTALSTVY